MNLNGKSILITGASRGIGAATAKRLAAQGVNLALCGRDEDALRSVAAECGAAAAQTALFPGDMADTNYVSGLPGRVAGHFGGLHVLFNNAGILDFAPADQADLAVWDKVLDVNFRSWMHLTAAALPLLTANEESAIINLCSIAGRDTFPGGGIYTATKHAVHAWSRCTFEDMRAKGVKVCAIYPGYVRTEMTRSVSGDHGKMIQPEDVARTVEFILGFPQTACPTEIVLRPQYPLNSG